MLDNRKEVFALLVTFGVLIACCLLAFGCGTESGQSAQSVAVTPVTLATPTVMPDCNPPLIPTPGHVVRGYSYRVCAGDNIVQQVTCWVDAAPISADWPASDVPCANGSTDQMVCQ